MFKTYQDVQQYLGSKTDRPYPHGRATRVQKRAEGIAIKYHDTDVVLFTPEYIELNSGGWRTLTTKSRMNECLNHGQVWQHRGVWSYKGITYVDGLRIDYAGNVLNEPEEDAEAFRILTLTKQINDYAKNFVAALLEGKVGMPGPGDCWFCYVGENQKSMGDIVGDHDHLIGHLEESYFVPTLVIRAVNIHGSIAAHEWVMGRLFNHGTKSEWLAGIWAEQTRKALVAYLKNRLAVGR
jgi:hypothetical protein